MTDINAAIAEKVMGEPMPPYPTDNELRNPWNPEVSEGGNWILTTTGFEHGDEPLWVAHDYLHDERACHAALAKMREKGWNLVWMSPPDHVILTKFTDGKYERQVTADGSTFCEAACKAMLEAVDG